MKTAYSYIRFSTAEQKKGDSLRRQIELSEKYAEEHGLMLDQTLNFRDLGISAYDGSNLKRGDLGAFLRAVESGQIARGSYLLVESLDRLSRDQVLTALETFTSILRKGITIVTLADRMVYDEVSVANNYTSLVMSIMIMARSHEESLTKSKRIKAAWVNKRANIAEKKLTAQCPKWLQLSADKKTFSFVPERVSIIREIIQLSANGLGQALIAKRLNQRKEQPFSRSTNGWHTSYIAKVLNSSALYGEFQQHLWIEGKLQPHGDPIPDYFPALITKETFLAMQANRRLRLFGQSGSKGSNVPNLLGGIVKCGYCGSSMVLVGAAANRTIGPDGTTRVRLPKKVLVCDQARRGMGCYAVRWDYKDLEKSFLSFCRGLELQQLLDNMDNKNDAQAKGKSLQEEMGLIDAKIQEANRKVENLLVAIENGNAPSLLIERLAELQQKIIAYKTHKADLQILINRHTHTEKFDSNELQSMQEVINRLEEKTGDELFLLRAALADKIRKLVKEVLVHPAGYLTPETTIRAIEKDLLDAGYTSQKVAEHLLQYRSEPKRIGHATARYASRKDSGRHFIIKGRGQGIRVVYPDYDDPAKVIVEVGGGQEARLNKAYLESLMRKLKNEKNNDITTTG